MEEESPVSPVSPASTYVATFSRSNTGGTSDSCNAILPFDECDQLCKDLDYKHDLEKPDSPAHLRSRSHRQTLPDAPRIQLNSSQMIPYCLEDLDTPGMNKLNQRLWHAAPNPTIKSLSKQLMYERKIVVTEEPSLHLIWADDIVYIKPLPAYLCSYAFWQYLLDQSNNSIEPEERERLLATSRGFLRTYACLIKHRSDFLIARKNDLLSAFGHVSFESFTTFILAFDSILDKSISPRWRFGELQLDALNLHSAIHLHRWHLNRFESNYGAYFQRFFPVILFMFASFSVILSAMQVIISGRQIWDTENKGLRRTLGLFEWFCTEAIGWSLAFGILLVVWWICIVCAENWKRRRTMKKIKKKQAEEETLSP